jgi:hypothetical protein
MTQQITPRTPAPADGRASGAAPAGPAGRRGIVVLGAALVTAAAVAAAIVATNRDSGRPDDATAAATTQDVPGLTQVLPVARIPAPHNWELNQDEERKFKQVLQETERLDQTVFAREVESQQYEEYFIRLWDDFRAAEDKSAMLAGASAFETLTFNAAGAVREHDWGVNVTPFDGAAQSVDLPGWRTLVGRLRDAGFRPTELEFHQSKFEHEPGRPATSVVATVVHLVNEKHDSRHVVRTKLNVEWSDKPDKPGEGGMYVPRTIVATDLTLADRAGGPVFEHVALPGGTAERGLEMHDMAGFVLLYDLDNDGLSEIVVPFQNSIFRNKGNLTFELERMLPHFPIGIESGLIADFDGDALPDLLCSKGDNMYLARGAPGGRFADSDPVKAVDLAFRADTVTTLTAGDVDGDGDLDAWMGQYKIPYENGQIGSPYYDANDGYPAALLVNDGTGRFTDQTEAAGLAAKRLRRTFAGSFVDLDGDRDLDLLVNSDFAGLDIYYNDGKGKFTDVTDQVIDERHNFGMGHTFADFNLDGRLDMYTIGMSSTTARRLTAMGAGREDFPVYQDKRPQMGYGNRMFFAPPPPAAGAPPSAAIARYVQPAFKDEVARTGWSWGASAPDFDNDGDNDIFIANGHISSATCRDYCTTFWRRDIYVGTSKEDPAIRNLFKHRGLTNEMSWNGFEHDVLFMNEGGKSFLNVAHLMGVAFEFDSRNVISDDLDGDGKMDLLVNEELLIPRGKALRVLRNNWPTTHNWVGVRLDESRPGFSPLGAEVRVRAGGRTQVGRIVTGDSLHSQHANARHFGLGPADRVEWVEVAWPNGEVTRVENPPVNKWHAVRHTAAAKPAGQAVSGR